MPEQDSPAAENDTEPVIDDGPGPAAADDASVDAEEPEYDPSRIDQWLTRLGVQKSRRLIIGILGGSTVLIGIAMMVAPGPAFIVIPIGLAILATEFVWARRVMRRVYHTTLFAIGWVGLRDQIEAPVARIAFKMRLISRAQMEKQVEEAKQAPRPTARQRWRLIAALIVVLVLTLAALGIGAYLVWDRFFAEAEEQPASESQETPDA